jgi:hypothetical protein
MYVGKVISFEDYRLKKILESGEISADISPDDYQFCMDIFFEDMPESPDDKEDK